MEKTNITISKEELQQLIEDALYKATCSHQNLDYNMVSETEMTKLLGLSKVTLNKYRSEGRIPFYKVGRTIRYNYMEVLKKMKQY